MRVDNLLKVRQKGAMFGADARIALVVVSVLGLIAYSVITGVIAKSTSEAIFANMKNVDMAIAEYADDVGAVPESINNLFLTKPTDADQAADWNGPYLVGTATDYLMPAITFTQISNNCESTSSAVGDRMCSYAVAFEFCDVPSKIYDALVDYYSDDAEVNATVVYNSATECLTINYGKAVNGGFTMQNLYKVRRAS